MRGRAPKRILAAAAGVMVAAAVVARLLPAAQVAVLRYSSVVDGDVGSTELSAPVPVDRFFMQMRDLVADGWKSVSPLRVALRAALAVPLPRHAFMVVFDAPNEALAGVAEPVLREFGVSALCAPPRDENPAGKGAGGKAAGRGAISPVRGFDWLFGADGLDPALVGGRGLRAAWPFPLRTQRVVGGRHAWRAELWQDSVDPAYFGTLRFSHAEGEPFPCSLLVYGDGGSAPAAQADLPALAPGEEFRLPIPVGVSFPLSVVVYDISRTVWQFESLIPRSAVLRKPGYRVPVAAPGAVELPESSIPESQPSS